jgi:RimJ/RimL family protein N-acetyltransferase
MGSAVLELAISHAFNYMAIDAITAGVYEFNSGPLLMLEKLGFERTPTLDIVEESKWGMGILVQKTYILESPTRQ